MLKFRCHSILHLKAHLRFHTRELKTTLKVDGVSVIESALEGA